MQQAYAGICIRLRGLLSNAEGTSWPGAIDERLTAHSDARSCRGQFECDAATQRKGW